MQLIAKPICTCTKFSNTVFKNAISRKPVKGYLQGDELYGNLKNSNGIENITLFRICYLASCLRAVFLLLIL